MTWLHSSAAITFLAEFSDSPYRDHLMHAPPRYLSLLYKTKRLTPEALTIYFVYKFRWHHPRLIAKELKLQEKYIRKAIKDVDKYLTSHKIKL